MKKYIICIVLLAFSVAGYSQVVRVLSGFEPTTGRPGYIYRDTSIALPKTTLKYFTGYGTFGSLPDSVRAAISLTTTGTGAATYVSGVLNIPTPGNAFTSQALTDGATITWDYSSGSIATVTLGGNRTLAITNPVTNSYGQITLTQDGTGTRTITLPASSKVISGGAGAITLTTTAAAKDILTFFYDGSSYYWNYGKNYN